MKEEGKLGLCTDGCRYLGESAQEGKGREGTASPFHNNFAWNYESSSREWNVTVEAAALYFIYGCALCLHIIQNEFQK